MKKIKKIVIFLIIVGVLGFVGYYVYNNYYKNTDDVKVIKTIPKYGYTLDNNETKLYNDTFNELDSILSKKNVNYEEYAKTISKLFIIDFYTLDNKVSKNDIGGVEFIRDSMRDNFIEEARSTFYKYLEQKEGRKQALPEVSKINSVSATKTTYMVYDTTTSTTKKTKEEPKGTSYEAYKVSIAWSYKKDLGYEKQANMILIKDGKMLYIVEMD